MANPTSTIFDVLDWNQRSASTEDSGDRLITDANDGALASYITVETTTIADAAFSTSNGLLLRADSTNRLLDVPVLSTYRRLLTVPGTFTFEVDVSIPADLPSTFEDKDDRIFIGAGNAQGYTAGILFSRRGLALCSTPYADATDVVPLSGSERFILPGNQWPENTNKTLKSVTIRISIDDDAGRASVYITDEDDAYETDRTYGAHELRYTIPAVPSTLTLDQILIAVRSRPNDSRSTNYRLQVQSLRIASTIVDAPDKPTAVVPEVRTAVMGRRVSLDGRGSYDPSGAELAYSWEIEEAPTGSTATLRGYVASSATVGTVALDNQLKFSHRTPSSRYDGLTIDLVSKTLEAAALSMEVVTDTYIRITLSTNSNNAILTNAYQLVQAFIAPTALGYNADVAAILKAELSDGVSGTGLLTAQTITLSGGVGSNQEVTVIQPDKVGLYRMSLRVSNGDRLSDPVILSLLVSHERQLLGHRPNTEYIWKALPDFWAMVRDRAQFEVVWSAVSQVVSDQLLRLYQHDYAKGIQSIGRRFQRRWIDHTLRTDIPASLQSSLQMSSGAHYFMVPDSSQYTPGGANITFSTLTQIGQVVLNPDVPTPVALSSDLDVSTSSPVILINTSGSVVRTRLVDILDTYKLLFSTQAINAARTIASGLHGIFPKDPDSADPSLTNLFSTYGEPFDVSQVNVGDYLVIQYGDTVISRIITDAAPLDSTTYSPDSVVIDKTVEWTVSALEPLLPTDSERFKWAVLRVGANMMAQVTQQPYFDLGSLTSGGIVDLRPLRQGFGDAAEISYVSPFDGQELTAQVPILHVTSTEVFVDWRPFFEELNILSVLGGHSQTDRFSLDRSRSILVGAKITAVIRTENTPVHEDITSIPQMGPSTVSADLLENRDYTISDGFIRLTPLNEGVCSVLRNSSIISLRTPLVDSEIHCVILGGLEIGIYGVVSVSDDKRSIVVSHTFSYSGTTTYRTPRYSFSADLPERLWAELTYFNNDQTIENNFGLLVGMPKSLLEEASADLDYLTIVRALWFAYMSGPTISTLKLACEAFVGLPFAQRGGQVTVINENDTSTLGRIVVKKQDVLGYDTYYYPVGFPIGVHPTTGRKIKAVSISESKLNSRTKEEQKQLQALIDDPTVSEITTQYVEDGDGNLVEITVAVKDGYRKELKLSQDVDDATLPEYTSLLDAVKVYDYVSNPTGIQQILPAEKILERFHTFVVELPFKSLGDLGFVSVLQNFVDAWRPQYTNVIFFAVMPVTDQIDIQDKFTISDLSISLQDSVYTQRVVKTSLATSGATQVPHSWPSDKVLARNPDTPTWAYDPDVHDKFDCGYVSGIANDYAGDGSWNVAHGVLDMVNSADSELDVTRCRMWVPIQKMAPAIQFVVGEEVTLWDGANWLNGYGWDSVTALGYPEGDYPVILHIGSGEHPRITFGVYNPQDAHPHTYLILGFYKADGSINFGGVTRLRALQRRTGSITYLKGRSSGAVCAVKSIRGQAANTFPNVDIANDITHADHSVHRPYFLLHHLFETDLLITMGPKEELRLQTTQYIPLAGSAISTLDVELNETPSDLQVQVHPYDAATPDNEQLVPSFSPGLFTNWSNLAPANDIVWGWTDAAELSSSNQVSAFTSIGTVTSMKNLHLGASAHPHRYSHWTHGFTKFVIPPPDVRYASESPLTYVRVEGYFFVEDDPFRVAVPSSTPSSFDGTIGGGWLFLRESDTLVEHPVLSYTFETGQAGSAGQRYVMAMDGFTQTSTGHVMVAPIPVGLPDGMYDVIVRNYRPWKLNSGDSFRVHMDENILIKGVYLGEVLGGGMGGEDHGGGDHGS